VDPETIYRILQENLRDFDRFARTMLAAFSQESTHEEQQP
jgi:uncharacterized protein YutE (UPF0331/DUF86 family)